MRVSVLFQTTLLMAASLAALPSFAQTSADPNRSGGATGAVGSPPTTNTDPVDRDRNHDYGWVGLLGLAGLAGLMRRGHHHETGRVVDTPTGKNRV